MVKTIVSDNLRANIFGSRADAGAAAAADCAAKLRDLLKQKDVVNMLFAAAPSQNEMLSALINERDIDWTRVRAFHMDEYIGLSIDAPQRFANFLKHKLFDVLPFKEICLIGGRSAAADSGAEEYISLIKMYPPDIVCLGIGENGHIAFNDPHVADFNDGELLKKVQLDHKCRVQQVNDGCFGTLSEVPEYALTVTIPVIMAAKHLICTVPGPSKADAVFDTLKGPVQTDCPASVMRLHGDACMYLDCDSARHILFSRSVITDEVSQDFEAVARFAKKHRLEGLEIRSVWDCKPEDLTEKQVLSIKGILTSYGLKTVCICSSLFKSAYLADETEKLHKAAALARKLDCKFIRGFSYFKDEAYSDEEFARVLQNIEPILEDYGVTLLIETDPSVNLTNAAGLSRLLDRLGSERIAAVWDPGNNIFDPENERPYPDGYKHIKPFMRHMHLKDAVKKEGTATCVALGEGEVDYAGQFKELIEDGYEGFISLETHYKKDRVLSDALMVNPMGEAFSEGGYETSEESLLNLGELIARAVREADESI